MDTMAALFGARAHDDNTGLVAGDASWTWSEVVAGAAQRASVLAERRAPGSFHVATLLDNVPEHVLWLGGAAMAGAVLVGGNPTHRGADLARDLAHTECQLLVTDRAHLPLVDGLDLGAAIGTVSSTNRRVLVVDDPGYHDTLAAHAGAPVPDPAETAVEEESLGYLIFTSGTSGAPKACRCTHGRLARIGVIVAQMFSLTPDDTCYVAMPLFHSNALMAGLSPAVAGGATVALPTSGRFSASGFLPDVRRHGVTYFNYVGKPLSYVLATPEQPDDADNTLVRVFGNEGAEADVVRFGQRFGCVVVDSYGSTEGGATVQRTPDTPRGALGRAPEGTMVVDPDTGQECPPARFDTHGGLVNAEESIGELVSAGGAAGFEGYWRNDDAERARLRNGWYWTGDLAYRDEQGFFYFAGRADDWLRVDGENFAAAPVARILERHPDVVLAAVYAVPDPVVGDQVMAALQMRPGAVFDAEEFAGFLAGQPDLGTKWTPRFVRVCPEVPVTATSKVLVRALRAERWNCADPVWWHPGRAPGTRYQPLVEADVADLEESVRNR
ncbi:MAG: long-chain-fatty-acid--CoA ligase [Acidimicrobiales bacterium]|jgi:fatty-acyl-CoA synthase